MRTTDRGAPICEHNRQLTMCAICAPIAEKEYLEKNKAKNEEKEKTSLDLVYEDIFKIKRRLDELERHTWAKARKEEIVKNLSGLTIASANAILSDIKATINNYAKDKDANSFTLEADHFKWE